VADLLTNSTPDSALGYRMRRYAIWHGITSVPPTRDEVRTDLAAVSPDRVAEYRECLDKAPDADLWQRIEQSLSVSPFWLDGHWFSARTASALGYEACAQAIREDVKAFIERLPKLTELTFNDGTPFLGGEAADWLWAAPAGNGGKGASANPWELAFDQARELVSKNALPAAMQLMDEGLAESREPRDRFYWRLTNAQVLKEAGLGALATQQIADLHSQVQELALNEWEPALIRQLDRLA
ncbi:MAG: type VI secretion system protein TssA, partial [Marinobacter alexandrii]